MLDILNDLADLVSWLIHLPVRPAPEPVPARVRTGEEQRQYDECNRTIRPGTVRYTVKVKPD